MHRVAGQSGLADRSVQNGSTRLPLGGSGLPQSSTVCSLGRHVSLSSSLSSWIYIISMLTLLFLKFNHTSSLNCSIPSSLSIRLLSKLSSFILSHRRWYLWNGFLTWSIMAIFIDWTLSGLCGVASLRFRISESLTFASGMGCGRIN